MTQAHHPHKNLHVCGDLLDVGENKKGGFWCDTAVGKDGEKEEREVINDLSKHAYHEKHLS